MNVALLLNITGLVGIGLSAVLLFITRRKMTQSNLINEESRDRLRNAKREIENEKKETLLKVKDEVYKKRIEFEADIKRERSEIDRLQARANSKYELLEKKEHDLDDLKRELQQKERTLSRAEDNLRANET